MVANEEARAIERMMRGCLFGNRVYHYDVLESTQIEAKRLAEERSPEGTLVVARVQTKAYGRRQTAWDSKAGGLWFSLLIYPKFGPDYAETFSLAVVRGIQDVLAKNFPKVTFEVKAPNDILALNRDGSKKKVCGIILEGNVTGNRYDWLMLGIGLNVNNEIDESLKDIAVTLEELTGSPVPRMPLLKTILQNLYSSYLQATSA